MRVYLRRQADYTHDGTIAEIVAEHYGHGDDPRSRDAIGIIRRNNGTVVAWVEKVEGPAPDSVSAAAVARGVKVHAARLKYRGRGDRELKEGEAPFED